MSSFLKGLGWGFGLLLAFLIFAVGSCAVLSKAGYEGLKEISQKLEQSNG